METKQGVALWSDLLAAYEGVGAERPWFAEGAIEGAPIVMFSGPEKTHKSWSGMQLAAATVLGGEWLGRFPIRQRGSVVYLDGEYGEHEFARRLARLARGMGADPRDVMRDVRHLYSAGLTLSPKDELLTRALADIAANPPKLVAVDPLRNHIQGSENDAAVILDAYRGLDRLRNAGGCPVFVIHHLNKSGGMSGSRAIHTRADLIIEGSDNATPIYETRGRTVRPALDPIASPFRIEMVHEHDADDSIASTRLAYAPAEARSADDGPRCSPEQLEKVRSYIESDPSASLVLAHVAEGAEVSKNTARAALIALEGEIVTPRPKDGGRHMGWERLA